MSRRADRRRHRTISIHAAFAANDVNGMRSRPQSLRFLIRFSTWPWRRCRNSSSTASPGWLVSTTWCRIPLWSHSRSWAPGWGRSRRTIARVPGGPAVDGEVELGDLGAAAWFTIAVDRWLPRVVGDLGDGGVQSVGNTGGDRELTVAGDQPIDEPAHAPAESARTRIGCTTLLASSPGSVTASVFDGQLARSPSRPPPTDRRRSSRRVPGRSTPASASPVASRKQNIGWNPNPRLKCGVAPCLRSEWISTSDASTSNTTSLGCTTRGPRSSLEPVRGRPATRRARCHRWCRTCARSSPPRRPRRTRQADHATLPCPQHSARQRRASPRPDRTGGPVVTERPFTRSMGSRPNTPM